MKRRVVLPILASKALLWRRNWWSYGVKALLGVEKRHLTSRRITGSVLESVAQTVSVIGSIGVTVCKPRLFPKLVISLLFGHSAEFKSSCYHFFWPLIWRPFWISKPFQNLDPVQDLVTIRWWLGVTAYLVIANIWYAVFYAQKLSYYNLLCATESEALLRSILVSR